MSLQLIQQYYTKVEKAVQYGGSRNEGSIRHAFHMLLEGYCAGNNLELIPELEYKTAQGKTVYPDGTLKDALRQAWGYWESKDEFDSLDEEIDKKLARGYPTTNILFEDGQTAVLIQNGHEASRADFRDAIALHSVLTSFVSYEPQGVRTFRDAIERFKADLPGLVTELRGLIELQADTNARFAQARAEYHKLCQEAINPSISLADIREMIIQHILTEEIFITIFNESQFHRENNIARELGKVIGTFFTGAIRKNILGRIDSYYLVIKAAASNIHDHHEKQRFLKVVYENFYKAYNPAGADRLGIVYTPNEIVRFMIEGADYLTCKHFGRFLGDTDVEILDPATGTGTFVTELIEYLPKHCLPHKYANEIYCNEVAILPYYIANLNIEFTYAQKMGEYAEFRNICFVDTLDNLGFTFANKQYGLFELTAENLDRIKRQNARRISVIVGNPPYNAQQVNENENNKNRGYPGVDKRIKATYIKYSSAQKTKLYDMYIRFFRWASDRLADNGVLAFVSNRSFIDKRDTDGFRRVVAEEFSEIYIVDLGGDVRMNPKLSGPKHNVFAIQTGVAICFMVRKPNPEHLPGRVYYARRPELETAREKLQFLAETKLAQIPFEHIQPDKGFNWINLAENQWDDLMPVAARRFRGSSQSRTILGLLSTGMVTARDEWVVDVSPENLRGKIEFLTQFYNLHPHAERGFDTTIKWSRNLKERYARGLREALDDAKIQRYCYRPFVPCFVYYPSIFVDEDGSAATIFAGPNVVIAFTNPASAKPFSALASRYLIDFHLNGDSQYLPLYRYDASGQRQDNITAWALGQFQEHYGDTAITREAIFHYVYGVLHDPAYRAKYALNLKRELPRIPFCDDFWRWSEWGQKLLDLHLNYETAQPYPLERVDRLVVPTLVTKSKPRLKANKGEGVIEVDTVTTLNGIPPQAWAYKLGNRCALEWILDQHKETKPKDPTIAARFDTYRFADYKEQVVDLLQRVCTVSVETMRIVDAMGGGG